jgi:hypothetical protein
MRSVLNKLEMLAAALTALSTLTGHARTVATDCTLILPANPLTAAGLSTPFQLTNTKAREVCHELDPDQSAFVQAAILDPQTGQISIYAPLVIDKGTQPAVAPIVPVLPPNAVVALWFGFNANNLKLRGSGFTGPARGPDTAAARSYGAAIPGREHEMHPGSTTAATAASTGARTAVNSDDPSFGWEDEAPLRLNHCVNGVGATLFSQFSYCNAVAFFEAANAAVAAGKLVIPPLGTGADGQLCPSVRSFTVVDQDQSDNVPTNYLAFNGQVAQYNVANVAALTGATKFGNPSDNRLVDLLLDPALNCTPWTAPDLSNPGVNVPALPLNELQAQAFQPAPVALVPLNDPMTLISGADSLIKVNAYRRGVNQPHAWSNRDADPFAYCANLRSIHPARLALDRSLLAARPSPFPLMANSLFTFMAQRYVTSYALLGCQDLLNKPVNVTLTTDAAGVVIDAALPR